MVEEIHQNNINEEQISDDDSDQFATIKRCPKDVMDNKKIASTPTTPQEFNPNNAIVNEHIEQITEQQFVDEIIYGDIVDTNIRARALYDYQAGLIFILKYLRMLMLPCLSLFFFQLMIQKLPLILVILLLI